MIIIKNLSKSYRRQTVLDNVSLHIPRGNIFALLGPNGSGKTTLLKSILGLVHPLVGADIVLDGESIIAKREYKNKIGYMPQIPKFPPNLRVKELISLFEKLRQKKSVYKEHLVRDLKIDLFWEKTFGELSGGMTQKINLLQCFMFETQLFVLDEPTLGLDPHVAFYLKNLIRSKKKEGRTVLFTSHIMSEVDELADQMALLVEGKIYTVTTPEKVKLEKKTTSLEGALHQFWDQLIHTKNHVQ